MRVVIILLELLVYLGSALKQVIDRIGGKVVVLGCPAEEGGEMVVQKLHMLRLVLSMISI